MKTIVIALLIFIIGFVSAKYFYNQKNTTTITQEVDEPKDINTQETNESNSIPKENDPPETASPKASEEAKVNPTDYKSNDKIKNDTKLQDYEKQLESLDQKIDNDLNQLNENDPQATKKLNEKINEKIKKLPGDDELTEKEYQ